MTTSHNNSRSETENVPVPANRLTDEQRREIQVRLRRHYLADDVRTGIATVDTAELVESVPPRPARTQSGAGSPLRLWSRLTLRGAGQH